MRAPRRLASLALVLAAAAPVPSALAQTQTTPGPVDLRRYTPVLVETFEEGLRPFDGTRGIWNLSPRRPVTNGPQSAFLSPFTRTPDGRPLGLDPFTVEGGVLHIGSGPIPAGKLDDVHAVIRAAGQERQADKVRYYTGWIGTGQTWGQRYGYYEIRAKIPQGRGHWPAFWLAPVTKGWPPEIDVMEAFGRGIGKPTPQDNHFNVATFFDARDIDGQETLAVDITNPFDPDGKTGGAPVRRERGGGVQYMFQRSVDAMEELGGADIYEHFWTYAATWTPTEITFFFGPDRDHLREIFRTPTPPDLHSPMAVIANDQVSAFFGWNPIPGQDHKTFAPGNTFQVEEIRIYALDPEREVRAPAGGGAVVDADEDSVIRGSPAADTVAPGAGQDQIHLGGGADTLFVEKSLGNKIVRDFGADDTLVLEGFNFENRAAALATLTPVGADTWLINPGDPFRPMTIAFADTAPDTVAAADVVVRWSVSRAASGPRLRIGEGETRVRGTADRDNIADASPRRGPDVTLEGLGGDDTYFVTRPGTRIVEREGGGVDTVRANTHYTLPAFVENLVDVSGDEGHRLTGNEAGNRLEGKPGSTLDGAGGDDLLVLDPAGGTVVSRRGGGHDTVENFGADARLVLEDHPFADFEDFRQALRAENGNTVLRIDAERSLTFRGSDPAAFASGNVELGARTAARASSGAADGTADRLRRPVRTP